jgi:hypothetical protein
MGSLIPPSTFKARLPAAPFLSAAISGVCFGRLSARMVHT